MSTLSPRFTLALCGVGRMGQIRADCLLANPHLFRVLYVVDPISTQIRDDIAAKLNAQSASRLCEVIASVDAVMLCTPTAMHAEDVRLAIEHKKPVFAEKPLAFTKRDTYDVYEKAKAVDLPVFVAYNRRAAKQWRELKGNIADPKQIHRISFVFRDNPMLPPAFLRTLGDIYEDISCHALDLALWYLEEKPIKVYAKGLASFNDQGVVDGSAAIIQFSNQRAILCDWTRKSTNNYDERIEIFLSDKTISGTMANSEGKNAYSFRETYWDSYMNEIEQFQNIVQQYVDTKSFKIERPYECCLWVIDIVNALQRSTISGKEEFVMPTNVVKMSLIGGGKIAKFVENEVVQNHFWDYYQITSIYNTPNEYKNNPPLSHLYDTIYLCVGNHSSYISEVVSQKKHVICEKPAFNSLSQYLSVCSIARQEDVKVFVNFNERYEKYVDEVKTLVNNDKNQNVSVEFSSQGGAAKESVLQQLYDDVINQIDLSVYLSWPFVSADITDLKISSNTITQLTINILKPDGRTITHLIHNNTHGNTPLSQDTKATCSLSVNGKTVHTTTHSSSSNTDAQLLDSYKSAFLEFYESLVFSKPSVMTNIFHPTFYWTYKLLDEAVKFISEK